jgi:hypothetical protein
MVGRHGITVSLIFAAFVLGVWVGDASVDAQRTARVLEVRRYTANPGKLDKQTAAITETTAAKHALVMSRLL